MRLTCDASSTRSLFRFFARCSIGRKAGGGSGVVAVTICSMDCVRDTLLEATLGVCTTHCTLRRSRSSRSASRRASRASATPGSSLCAAQFIIALRKQLCRSCIGAAFIVRLKKARK